MTRRFLCTLAAALTLGIGAAAQASEGRTITSLTDNFGFGLTTILNIPDTGDNINVSGFTTEAGEPGASCTGAALSRTGWFRIVHPGGTLDINTAYATGSSYDTVVQIFAADTGMVDRLAELGCDNNSGGGAGGDDARLIMPGLASEVYYVRIACIATCGSTTDLALQLSYTPAEPAPDNNNVAAAAPITVGKALITQNIEHATVQAGESALPGGCTLYFTTWYLFTAPHDGSYTVSVFGSYLWRSGTPGQNADVAVYKSSGGANFANFSSLGCGTSYGGASPGLVNTIALDAGEQVYIRVGSSGPENMRDGSYYRVKLTFTYIQRIFANSDFESGSLAPWKLAIVGPDDGIYTGFPSPANDMVVMSGAPGKTNKLSQKWRPADFGIKLPANATLQVGFNFGTNGTVSNNVKAVVKVTYSNGAPPTTASVTLLDATAVGLLTGAGVAVTTTSTKVANIALIVKNKSTGGQIFIDNVVTTLYGDPGRASKGTGVLPPPD